MHLFDSWYQATPEWRLSFLRNRIAELELLGQSYDMLHPYFKQFERFYLDPISLQGPTGEDNQLFLTGRGKALIYKNTPSGKMSFIQVIIALLTGNEVYYNEVSDLTEQLQSHLVQAGFDTALHLIDSETWHEMLTDPDVSVISVIDTRYNIYTLALKVAKRHSMIPQFLYEIENEPLQFMSRPDYLTYWTHEKTKTVNTTAVGGNAQLLELINC